MPIPSTTPPSPLFKETPSAVVAGVVALVAGAFALAKELQSTTRSRVQVAALAVALLGGLALGALAVGRARRKDQKESNRESPDDLRGCLHVIHASIRAHKRVVDPKEGWLRVTVHRLDGEFLEQSVDYVGSEDHGAARRFSITTGLIGRVARMMDVRKFDRPADMKFDEWIGYLVEELGLTRAAAEQTRRDRHAFLGVPIMSPGGREVRAVVYLDAGQPDFFDDRTTELAVAGCAGLALWVDEHYYQG